MSRLEAILLLGPTGAGKTPLGNHLERDGLGGRRCHHFDFGARLRALSKQEPSDDFSASDIAFVRQVLAGGVLLENAQFWIAEKLLRAFLAERHVTSADLVVLNGLPRHCGQAEALDRLLDVVAVIHLDCDARTVRERLRCDSGGDREGRVDDEEELVGQKLATYRARTEPLLTYYRARQIPVLCVPVEVETTAADLGARVVSLLT